MSGLDPSRQSRDLLRLSHDLRTPLTIISGYLEMLEDDNLPAAERRRLHGIVREAAAELSAVIDQALIEHARDTSAGDDASWACLG